MAVQPGLCRAWSEILKTGFVATRLTQQHLKTDYRVSSPFSTEAYKGHCVLCKDVLSFVFQTFDFQILCFGLCFL